MRAAAPRPRILAFCLSIALTLAVSALGGLATARSVDTWYADLNKPWFNGPNWVFAPVWTGLHILMAIAAWRICLGPGTRSRRVALALPLPIGTLMGVNPEVASQGRERTRPRAPAARQ